MNKGRGRYLYLYRKDGKNQNFVDVVVEQLYPYLYLYHKDMSEPV
jgi:hypothetical protein